MTRQPFPYVPVDARGWRLAMGLRPLQLEHWIEIDARRDEELALKAELLATKPEVVVATRPEGDAELAKALRAFDAYTGGAPAAEAAAAEM